jgi:hypothetical protein
VNETSSTARIAVTISSTGSPWIGTRVL